MVEDDTSPEIKEKLLSQLHRLSPKKTGLFYETFNREKNDLLPSNDTFFDALTKTGKRVEIKASRALTFIEDEPENLFEQLLDSGAEFISFYDSLNVKFNCNIQQVKTSEFDILNYCIFFYDVILEFKINSFEIKNDNVDFMLHKLAKDVSKIKNDEAKIVMSRLDEINWSDSRRLNHFIKQFVEVFKDVKNKDLIDLYKHSGVLSEAYKNFRLGYSDKQHKGNVGEGQFHITNKNFLFHLENNFVKAYNYKDFIEVLTNNKVYKEKDERKFQF